MRSSDTVIDLAYCRAKCKAAWPNQCLMKEICAMRGHGLICRLNKCLTRCGTSVHGLGFLRMLCCVLTTNGNWVKEAYSVLGMLSFMPPVSVTSNVCAILFTFIQVWVVVLLKIVIGVMLGGTHYLNGESRYLLVKS